MAENNLNSRKEEIEALVVKVKEGDHEAFGVLYDILAPPLYQYIYYRVKSEDAEDLLETVFLKVWENINKYTAGKSAFSAWAFRIAHNLVIDYYRSAKERDIAELTIDIRDHKREHNPTDQIENKIDQAILKKAIAKIRKVYRDILIYKFINDFSNKEIADILKRSEGSVRILQFRALKALKGVLEEMGIKYDF